ncbi:hypothetical protein PLAN_100126 [Planktothrix rubescens CCAP 1459/22]|uniref:Uncharacterized protein n=1 Tax=Planktothrix rubescens CCAP 1459/22 TaxID=329571 RepID=A0A6J7ZEW1_PLARU|nr:hypothetical protein PLAN_100126 [Planktothrix rubescens NIVA-CYA 18]CAD0225979.1 conserved hypothetical protein [Planktothrix agardhii]
MFGYEGALQAGATFKQRIAKAGELLNYIINITMNLHHNSINCIKN